MQFGYEWIYPYKAFLIICINENIDFLNIY